MSGDPMGDCRNGNHSDVVYICDWLPPDFGAVGQYSEIFCRQFAASGQKVTLLGLTSGAPSDVTESHGRGRLRIVKLSAAKYDKADLKRRVIWTIITNTRLLMVACKHARGARRVIFTACPPLFLHWIAPANLFLRKPLTYRITDFHPECAIAERGRPSLFLEWLRAWTVFWRKRIDSFEVLGLDQAERLKEIGIPSRRIYLKPDPSPVAIGADVRPLPRPASAGAKILLLYSGNWGVAHDYETFTRAYITHHKKGSGRVVLWLNAVGTHAAPVAQALRREQVPLIIGEPVTIDKLAALLVTPDAHLITLSDPFVGYVLPSKVHGCIESGRAIFFVGSTRSDVHRLCAEKAREYIQVDAGDIAGCTAALEKLADTVAGTATPSHHHAEHAHSNVAAK